MRWLAVTWTPVRVKVEFPEVLWHRTVAYRISTLILMCICCTLYIFVVPYVYLLYYVCTAVLTLDARLLARSQYLEGPATGHIDTGFSWFPCVYK